VQKGLYGRFSRSRTESSASFQPAAGIIEAKTFKEVGDVFAQRKMIIGGLVAVAVVALGAGVGLAAAGNDGNPLTGGTYDRAAAAALAEVGEGTVTEAEREEGGGYEVEVQRDDGTEVEVQLDGNFDVTRSGSDDDGNERGEGDD
jgi:hypothetical protein